MFDKALYDSTDTEQTILNLLQSVIIYINNVHFVLDTFHQRYHTRHTCRNELRADHPLHKNMVDNVNSQIAEQTFFIISQYKTH